MDSRDHRFWKANQRPLSLFLLLFLGLFAVLVHALSGGSFFRDTPPTRVSSSPTNPDEESLGGSIRVEQAAAAIVIDDLGYNTLDLVQRALALDQPLAFAIIPLQPYSLEAASLVHQNGHEVILHLPLEPEEIGPNSSPTTFLRSDMNEEQRLDFLNHQLRALPYAIGINNHMGSKASKSKVVANQLMALIKRYGFFFVDSRTTPDSVLYKTALEYGIPSTKRDLFLDEDRSPTAIADRLEELYRLAVQNKVAVGIVHIYPETIDALESELPRLSREYPVSLVPVSSLVH